MIEKVLRIEQFEDLRRACQQPELGDNFFARILNSLRTEYLAPSDFLKRIPATGPVVIVANHPFGLIEGPVLGDAMLRVRPDVRFMANGLLHMIPELREWVIPVDPFGGDGAKGRNTKPLKDSVKWLRKGGLLIIFPAGEVSHWRFPDLRIADPDWNEMIVRLVKMSGATVVPLHFQGTNGPLFHAAGFVHPRLRTALLAREFFRQQDASIRFKVGSQIRAERLAEFSTDREAIEYLRRRVYVMDSPATVNAPLPFANRIRLPLPPLKRQEPLGPEIDSHSLAAELAALPPTQRLLTHQNYEVYVAAAEQIPATLLELGRLRELTFRQVGEGTGKPRDLDVFDQRYEHLLLWHRENRQIVGAYRLLRTSGQTLLDTLYTKTLFHLDPAFPAQLGPAIELGRSFIREEYQRSYQPLLLLWKGIGQIVLQSPDHARLFGPVSISADYCPNARELIVAHLLRHHRCAELSSLVKPRHPFRSRPFANKELNLLAEQIHDMDEFADVAADADPQQRALPVLLRHYLNLGGRLLNFNVDPDFSQCLDGLIMVDLRHTDPRILERYMGKSGAAAFLRHHGSLLPTAA